MRARRERLVDDYKMQLINDHSPETRRAVANITAAGKFAESARECPCLSSQIVVDRLAANSPLLSYNLAGTLPQNMSAISGNAQSRIVYCSAHTLPTHTVSCQFTPSSCNAARMAVSTTELQRLVPCWRLERRSLVR